QYAVVLAKTAGRTCLRMADAGLLPFDFRSFSKTVSGYIGELTTLADQVRENTALSNQLIKGNYYTYAGDPTVTLLPPPVKDEAPYLDFSPLQNAIRALEKATDRLADTLGKQKLTTTASDAVNQALYRAEQQLLSDNGLPRRPWYKHTIYAPGFYTGYGVKTLPGIREAIEQRNWKEAQEQIGIVAAVLKKFADYLDGIH
ncbi:MAG TPA: transferrin receptor-like dimerization domain-containing protein, partial [Puia sp.]|nr:transferrin receptor-like dimerization domain-containing protein [Puia sp.]